MHLQHVIRLYLYHKELSTTQAAAQEICDLQQRRCCRHTEQFTSDMLDFEMETFNLEDEVHPGRLCVTDEDQLRAAGKAPRQTTPDLAGTKPIQIHHP